MNVCVGFKKIQTKTLIKLTFILMKLVSKLKLALSFDVKKFCKRMAHSKFEYTREFEQTTEVSLLPNCFIAVRVDGKNFHRFSDDHLFRKPNDIRLLVC